MRARIHAALRRAGRGDDDARLLAVTKARPAADAVALRRLGQVELGENRIEGLAAKIEAFGAVGLDARWHFIGHIQRNKARRVVQLASVLHSVDSLRLLEALARVAGEEGAEPEIFLQLNLTGESHKHGLTADELPAALDVAGEVRTLRTRGLMVMGPTPGHAGPSTGQVFQRAAELRAEHAGHPAFRRGGCELSMGMSGDLDLALAHGSDWVRVGSALFEPAGGGPA